MEKVFSRTGTCSGEKPAKMPSESGPTGPGWSGAPVPSRAVWRRPAAFGVEQQRVSGPGVDKRCTARRRPARRPRSAVPLPACLPHCRSGRLLLRGPYPRRLWEARRAVARPCSPDPLRVERRAAPASSDPRCPRGRARRLCRPGTSPAAAAARRWRTASYSPGRARHRLPPPQRRGRHSSELSRPGTSSSLPVQSFPTGSRAVEHGLG